MSVPGRYQHNRDCGWPSCSAGSSTGGNDSIGDLSGDGLHASLLIIELAEQQEFTEAFDRSIPAGSWILTHDQQGFVTVDQYPTP
jgi:hypothetical protein